MSPDTEFSSKIGMINSSKPHNVSDMSVMTLAFVGDSVYSLMIREYLASGGVDRSGDLHSMSVKMVNAKYQSEAADIITPLLDEQEMSVFRRGRNAHTVHTPKNASEAQYHKATALEALFGWLYMSGKSSRLNELFIAATKKKENSDEEG